MSIGDRVHFVFDRYDLAPKAEATSRHADERGTGEYNLALGERRATSVRNCLVALGIYAERISVIRSQKTEVGAADLFWTSDF